MVVLGLTGSFGSGKSTVARFFRAMGADVIDADQLAREVVERGEPAYGEIIKAFGKEILQGDGRIDRTKLGQVIFGDQARRRQLEAIIHPRVREEEHRRIALSDADIIVVDVPLLFETGFDQECDKTCVVVLDEAKRMERLGEKLGLSPLAIQQRLQAQMPQEEKRRRADFVIDNSGTLEQTREQAICVMNTLKSMAGAKTPPKE